MPILCATYRPPKFYYKIPEDWDVKDIVINRGQVYYKGVKKNVPCHEMEEEENEPEAPLVIEDEGDYDFLFDDEDEDEDGDKDEEEDEAGEEVKDDDEYRSIIKTTLSDEETRILLKLCLKNVFPSANPKRFLELIPEAIHSSK